MRIFKLKPISKCNLHFLSFSLSLPLECLSFFQRTPCYRFWISWEHGMNFLILVVLLFDSYALLVHFDLLRILFLAVCVFAKNMNNYTCISYLARATDYHHRPPPPPSMTTAEPHHLKRAKGTKNPVKMRRWHSCFHKYISFSVL